MKLSRVAGDLGRYSIHTTSQWVALWFPYRIVCRLKLLYIALSYEITGWHHSALQRGVTFNKTRQWYYGTLVHYLVWFSDWIDTISRLSMIFIMDIRLIHWYGPFSLWCLPTYEECISQERRQYTLKRFSMCYHKSYDCRKLKKIKVQSSKTALKTNHKLSHCCLHCSCSLVISLDVFSGNALHYHSYLWTRMKAFGMHFPIVCFLV